MSSFRHFNEPPPSTSKWRKFLQESKNAKDQPWFGNPQTNRLKQNYLRRENIRDPNEFIAEPAVGLNEEFPFIEREEPSGLSPKSYEELALKFGLNPPPEVPKGIDLDRINKKQLYQELADRQKNIRYHWTHQPKAMETLLKEGVIPRFDNNSSIIQREENDDYDDEDVSFNPKLHKIFNQKGVLTNLDEGSQWYQGDKNYDPEHMENLFLNEGQNELKAKRFYMGKPLYPTEKPDYLYRAPVQKTKKELSSYGDFLFKTKAPQEEGYREYLDRREVPEKGAIWINSQIPPGNTYNTGYGSQRTVSQNLLDYLSDEETKMIKPDARFQ